ncbi:hypothetical protein BV22DRAFT_1041963 [Leucogyrophana mollusca]|uniref:Uncharacterized protein n=1 Tax=Leucogyrophana mollusca TaxID=85980 RepID=A0ACB8AYS9_9AGAM|nr:hypothetical protein BV22DRAFT_1041963 [Leucogyrophana mollusca]
MAEVQDQNTSLSFEALHKVVCRLSSSVLQLQFSTDLTSKLVLKPGQSIYYTVLSQVAVLVLRLIGAQFMHYQMASMAPSLARVASNRGRETDALMINLQSRIYILPIGVFWSVSPPHLCICLYHPSLTGWNIHIRAQDPF